MDKETLIKKWLDNTLTAKEFEAFKALEDYDSLIKLDEATKRFKATNYVTEYELNQNLKQLKTNKTAKNNWLKPVLKIAAVLLICFGVFNYLTHLDTTISTITEQKASFELPDHSQVTINAASQLTYNKKNWDSNRRIELNGEAYFKVTKGETFKVETTKGTVTVLGTQFNVKQRENYFEVICYEGSVQVDYQNTTKILKPQHSFVVYNKQIINTTNNNSKQPTWITNTSTFKSVPYIEVLKEFERQFNVTINSNSINTKTLFTGSFKHSNREEALQSITLPLRLKYKNSTKNSIILTSE